MSAEAILQNMLNNTDSKFDRSIGSFVYDIEKAMAIELEKLEIKNASFVDKIDVENLVGVELERFVSQRTPVTRTPATFANGAITIEATAPTRLEVGDLVAADDIFYQVVNATNVVTGLNDVVVRCTQAGSIGNVPVGAINAFPVTLKNIVSVTNNEPFENGYNEESDESLRLKYYSSLRSTGKAGNPDHFKEWAQEVPGVGKVKINPRWNGPLTVRVVILDVDNDFATEELMNNVYTHTMNQLSIGPELTVVTATKLDIDVTANFVLTNGYQWAEVLSRLTGALNQYFNEITFDDNLNYISYAQVGRLILATEGVADYSNLLINNGTVNIPKGEIEKPVIRSVSEHE